MFMTIITANNNVFKSVVITLTSLFDESLQRYIVIVTFSKKS